MTFEQWNDDFSHISQYKLDSEDEANQLANHYIQLLEANVGRELRLLTLDGMYYDET